MAKKKTVKKSKVKSKNKRKKKGGNSLLVLIIAVFIIGAVVLISKFNGGPAVKYIKSDKLAEWGDTGDKKGQMNSPRGVAVSPDGQFVYVSVLNNSAVYKYKQDGTFVSGSAGKGNKPGEFNEPSGISTDKDGNLYVADAWNGRIQKFDSKGKFLLEIGGVKGGFYSPRNVSVNKYGVVFVGDTGTSRIHRFDSEGNRMGNPVGGAGTSLGKFGEVFGIAFDSKGRVYAADAGNRRIEVFSSDLVPQSQVKVKAWKTSFPLWPMLAVDSRDRLYAVSSGTQEIIVFDTTGKKLKQIGVIKNDMREKPLFSNPLGIAIDQQDNLYITEITRNKVLKIKPLFEQ